jgi:ornithine carbamoyltransferase
LACPKGYEPDRDIAARVRRNGARVTVTHSIRDALNGADAIYTDVWTSMGQEWDVATRLKAFHEYQVNHRVLAMAKKDAVVMHCLPAHRGQEITDEVLESPQCIAFDQAENRLHAQKAIMVWLLKGGRTSTVPKSKGSTKKANQSTGSRGSNKKR